MIRLISRFFVPVSLPVVWASTLIAVFFCASAARAEEPYFPNGDCYQATLYRIAAEFRRKPITTEFLRHRLSERCEGRVSETFAYRCFDLLAGEGVAAGKAAYRCSFALDRDEGYLGCFRALRQEKVNSEKSSYRCFCSADRDSFLSCFREKLNEGDSAEKASYDCLKGSGDPEGRACTDFPW